MNTDITPSPNRRIRRVLLAALVAGTLTGGLVAAPVSAAPVGPTEEKGIEVDPCDLLTHGSCEDDTPVAECDETEQFCDFTAEVPDPDDEPDPEVESDVVTASPRFTG